MASLQTSSPVFSSPSCRSSSNRTIYAPIHARKLPRVRFADLKQTTKLVLQGLQLKEQVLQQENTDLYSNNHSAEAAAPTASTTQLYALLEAVVDRVEMHANIGDQRNNWNALLLSSINMITLSASLMAGVNAAAGTSVLALNISSAILFSVATGMLLIMNKIQPSQLAEEQRNATRLFRQLQSEIETVFALRDPTEKDVKETMEKVLALDKAYPLALLGAMLEKFPKKLEPTVWWPRNVVQSQNPRKPKSQMGNNVNGWSEELEREMREIIQVVKNKDLENYVRLGSSVVLKTNKILAVLGPVLTGIAAVGSAFVGHGSATVAVATVAAGSLASAVNAFQHGGQVGMVFEMNRNCAGFFNKLEDSIEATLGEQDWEKRENGVVFEMKVAMRLGRSLEQLRELASKSALYRSNGEPIDEFGCKLF
ncbi:probable F-box protein At4g22030 [Pyrus x bretschneideri]|uniref:probable F-box protein At4g22030 n=1 Tax=Pyrus x bretschneideri TaxID=225117 RepID=UPI002030394B|nr:probable F-box protein At4g22030 [Pyrus x bretschneideri]